MPDSAGRASPQTTKKAAGTTRYDAIVAEANRLNRVAPPYSNARPPNDSRGYDCSSSCADLMLKAGYRVPYFNTATAPNYMRRGQDPSGRLTFWNSDHAKIGGNSVHIFCTIGGRDWGTGANSQGGPGWHPHTKSGFDPYHITGLDEPASLPKGSDSSVPGGGGNVSGANQTGDTGQAAAFAAFFDLPGVMNYAATSLLTGDKSIYNDEPLLPFIQQLAKASLRHFQSLPNGTFYAFFPDQFGSYHHRKPYWEIDDIEIIDGKIQLTDDSLSTHVFIAGDTNLNQEIDIADQLSSKGVITIYDAFTSAFFTQDTEAEKEVDKEAKLQSREKAVQFLKRYGVRPLYEEDTFIRNGFFEVFYAFTRFQQQWSVQFATQFQFTFMPELYPGGIVALPSHGIQLYVEGVTHSFDYTSGFTTDAILSSPAAYGHSKHGHFPRDDSSRRQANRSAICFTRYE
jgi:hypothetical protein